MARDSQFAKMQQEAEVQDSHAQPLPHLRAPARLPAQVCNVPHLFPRAGAPGEIPGVVEGELVGASEVQNLMLTDPISDLLTRIRNAAKARHARVDMPASKLKTEVVRILKEEGYIQTYKLVEESKTARSCACS